MQLTPAQSQSLLTVLAMEISTQHDFDEFLKEQISTAYRHADKDVATDESATAFIVLNFAKDERTKSRAKLKRLAGISKALKDSLKPRTPKVSKKHGKLV